MQQINYTSSAYMPSSTTNTIEEFVENHELARIAHYADIFRIKLQVLEDAGLLTYELEMFAMQAIDRRSLVFMRAAHKRMDDAIDAM